MTLAHRLHLRQLKSLHQPRQVHLRDHLRGQAELSERVVHAPERRREDKSTSVKLAG